MKTLTTTQLIRTYKTAFKRIPEEGILITRNKRPVARIIKPDLKKKQEEVAAKAKAVIRTIKVDTFTEVEVDRTERAMGICDRCGRTGEVKKSGHVNKHGRVVGKWLCVSNCFDKETQPQDLNAAPESDFGRADGQR